MFTKLPPEPVIECWHFDEWRQYLDTARRDGLAMLVAALLAGTAYA